MTVAYSYKGEITLNVVEITLNVVGATLNAGGATHYVGIFTEYAVRGISGRKTISG